MKIKLYSCHDCGWEGKFKALKENGRFLLCPRCEGKNMSKIKIEYIPINQEGVEE